MNSGPKAHHSGPPAQSILTLFDEMPLVDMVILLLWLFYILNKLVFWPFLDMFSPLGGLPNWKEKYVFNEKVVSCWYLSGTWAWLFHFQLGNASKFQKKIQNKGSKVGCMFPCAVRAYGHVHWPKQFKTAWETKLHICWKFGKVQTLFGCSMNTWKNMTDKLTNGQTDKQTDKQTDNCKIYMRMIWHIWVEIIIIFLNWSAASGSLFS